MVKQLVPFQTYSMQHASRPTASTADLLTACLRTSPYASDTHFVWTDNASHDSLIIKQTYEQCT